MTVRLSLWSAVLTAAFSALACSPGAPASPTAAPAKPTAATGAAPAGSPAAAASQGAAASPAAGAPATGAAPAAANKPASLPTTHSSEARQSESLCHSRRVRTGPAARMFASRWGDYFPNKPNFIVENMPGAGGATGCATSSRRKRLTV